MKAWRQSQILEVVDREAISSQEALRQKLKDRGIDATQATLSRDLKELGLVNAPAMAPTRGRARSAPVRRSANSLRKAVSSLVRTLERVESLIVVRTDRGQAQGLAEWIDRAQLTEIAGTVAGDDTILLVCRGHEQATAVEARFTSMVKG